MITVLYESDMSETYKLDVKIEYDIVNPNGTISTDQVLEALAQTILDKIEENKTIICMDAAYDDFTIEPASYDTDDKVLSFNVGFDKKIVGKYFVEKVKQVLNTFETIIYYDGTEYKVTVRTVEPMLRYIGTM